MQLIQTVAPATEPMTLVEAKEFMRVLDTDSDTLITSMIIAVREHVENVTNRQLVSATFELISNSLIVRLPKNPITSITKIEYLDENGNYITLDASNYYLYEKHGVGYIEYTTAPTLQDHQKAMKVTFVSGYAVVPSSIKQYMRVQVSTLFENREKYVIGASISEFGNDFVENLLSSYKVRAIL